MVGEKEGMCLVALRSQLHLVDLLAHTCLQFFNF